MEHMKKKEMAKRNGSMRRNRGECGSENSVIRGIGGGGWFMVILMGNDDGGDDDNGDDGDGVLLEKLLWNS